MVRGSLAFASALIAIALAAPSARAQGSTGGDDRSHRAARDLGVSMRIHPARGWGEMGTTTQTSRAAMTWGLATRSRVITPLRDQNGLIVDIDVMLRGILGESSSIGEW